MFPTWVTAFFLAHLAFQNPSQTYSREHEKVTFRPYKTGVNYRLSGNDRMNNFEYRLDDTYNLMSFRLNEMSF